MAKMDEFVLNNEKFVLKKTVCTHHQFDKKIPDVDSVISKVLWLKSGQKLEEFGNVYNKQERVA